MTTPDERAPAARRPGAAASAHDLRRLSALLDTGLDLPTGARSDWLGCLGDAGEPLADTLRSLLAESPAEAWHGRLECLPAFPSIHRADGALAQRFRAGDQVGPYRLTRPLGRGGSSEVWRARRAFGRRADDVALKLVLETPARSRNATLKAFAHERDLLGAIVHPNVVELVDAGIADDGQSWLALELVGSESLSTLGRGRPADARERVARLRQIATALAYLHARHIVHGDVKPGNVAVDAGGRAVLLDFGAARRLDAQLAWHPADPPACALTPGYASPEQWCGGPIGPRCDVYSLGLLLHELLAGQRPEQDAQAFAATPAWRVEPRPPRVGPITGLASAMAVALWQTVVRATRQDPFERHADAGEFVAQLDRSIAAAAPASRKRGTVRSAADATIPHRSPPPKSMSTSVLIVEDEPEFLRRFSDAVLADASLSLLAAVSTGSAGKAMLDSQAPDVMLVDLGLPDMDGVDLIRHAAQRRPGIDVLVVTMFGDDAHVVASIEAGATGYLLKDAGGERIAQSIHELRAGGSPISPSIARRVLQRFRVGAAAGPSTPSATPAESPLSERETEILRLVAKGLSFDTIGELLQISSHTVVAHVKNIYRKLAVHSRGEAVYEASQMGLL